MKKKKKRKFKKYMNNYKSKVDAQNADISKSPSAVEEAVLIGKKWLMHD